MSPNYWNRKRDRQLCKSLAGVAARERKRRERTATDPGWSRVATLLVTVDAAPDGRSVALHAHGQRDWFRCGSERAVRGALVRVIYGHGSNL